MTKFTCNVTAVILAAGCSARMGTNKLMLPLGEKTLLDQFLTSFPFSYFRTVIAVYSDDRVAGVLRKYPVTLRRNPHPEQGKSSSIKRALPKECIGDGIMFFVADQPLLTKETVGRLLETFTWNRKNIVLPRNHGKHANPVIFPAALLPEFEKLEEDQGGNSILQTHRHFVSSVEINSTEEFVDIDTPDAYLALQRRWIAKI